WLAWAEDLAASSRRKKGAQPMPQELLVHRLMPVDALAIRGVHNTLNALAAIALARAIGCPLGPMMHALRRYQGEPHRLQLIATIDGVEYYDDSKGTNVGATGAAIEGMSEHDRKLVVILGGDSKGQNFAPLVKPLVRHARAVVLIGRDAPLIRRALETELAYVPVLDASSLERAVTLAAERAVAGDAVLLSPACASFDMFRNYVHRGEAFAASVHELASAPQPC
ncbi:MAG: UDP-N-acetylmuramoyl-L-alanine--D-glutamate ligase, partial [Pseudomonadota bacterium]|nr:UDP-N-acetylmuramoyl-L-alanine--D-glutamate ligase [Pseudomonadota bacterium]